MDIRRTAELLRAGLSQHEIARQTRTGALTRVRHGSYISEPLPTDPRERQLTLIAATTLSEGTVLSHQSAAALHGLPLPLGIPDVVTATRAGRGGGHVRPHLHVRCAPLEEVDVVSRQGVRLTSLARTAYDLARSHGLDAGVAAVDAATRRGVGPATWDRLEEQGRRWPGSRDARFALRFRHGNSESPGESVCRLRFRQIGIPDPTLQFEIIHLGQLLGRSDFGWPELRLLGEFDGRVKYGRLLQPGEAPGDVVHREKRREERICALGWWFARFTWADFAHPEAMLTRWQEAAAVASRHL